MTTENITNDVRKLLVSMLTENTGRHILDSGGAYGRNWEHNQGMTVEDFEKRDSAFPEFSPLEPKALEYFVVDVYHYLKNQLWLDELCYEYNKMAIEDWDADELYGVSAEQEKWLKDKGFEVNQIVNTYNFESMLNQVLQYALLYNDDTDDHYILLQIHGGCDVRGGYTDAKLFVIDNDIGDGMLEPEDVAIYINGTGYELMGGIDLIDSESGMLSDLNFDNVQKDRDTVEAFLLRE